VGTGFRPGGRRFGALALVLAGVLLAGAGCGKGAFTYVANQGDKTYFKVPSGWTAVDPRPVDEFFMTQITGSNPDSQLVTNIEKTSWSVEYDSSSQPSGVHVVTPYPTKSPVVYSLVVHPPSAVEGVISFDVLRNLFLPVTVNARNTAAAEAQQSGEPVLQGFELLDDEKLTPVPGVHGVRVIFNYLLGQGVLHTFDLTVLTNDAASTLYVILARCTADCYRKRVVEINDIVTSFTVRSKA
jgi:hypothetical protein